MCIQLAAQPPDFQPVVYWLLLDSLSQLIAALVDAQPPDFQPVMYWLLLNPSAQLMQLPYLSLLLPWFVPNLLISSQSYIGCCLTPQLGLCSLLLVPNPLSPAY